MRVRKRPVEVEAHQWFKNGDHPSDDVRAIQSAAGGFYSEGKVVRYYRVPSSRWKRTTDGDGRTKCPTCTNLLHLHGWIDTFEGGHIVCPGDWIITGVKGERYPCKHDIFLRTYDPADAEAGVLMASALREQTGGGTRA